MIVLNKAWKNFASYYNKKIHLSWHDVKAIDNKEMKFQRIIKGKTASVKSILIKNNIKQIYISYTYLYKNTSREVIWWKKSKIYMEKRHRTTKKPIKKNLCEPDHQHYLSLNGYPLSLWWNLEMAGFKELIHPFSISKQKENQQWNKNWNRMPSYTSDKCRWVIHLIWQVPRTIVLMPIRIILVKDYVHLVMAMAGDYFF